MLSPTDTVGPTWTDPDPGWAGCTGTGPAGPDPADHHPAAPDSCHRWPDPGNPLPLSIHTHTHITQHNTTQLIWKGQTAEPNISHVVEMGKKAMKNVFLKKKTYMVLFFVVSLESVKFFCPDIFPADTAADCCSRAASGTDC